MYLNFSHALNIVAYKLLRSKLRKHWLRTVFSSAIWFEKYTQRAVLDSSLLA